MRARGRLAWRFDARTARASATCGAIAFFVRLWLTSAALRFRLRFVALRLRFACALLALAVAHAALKHETFHARIARTKARRLTMRESVLSHATPASRIASLYAIALAS